MSSTVTSPASEASLGVKTPITAYLIRSAVITSFSSLLFGFEIAVISGPALGGLLYLAGATVLFTVVLSLFGVTVILLGFVQPVPIPVAAGGGPGGARDLLEGLRFVLQRRVVLGSISLDLFAVLFGGATALLPIYASDLLHVGPTGLGALRSAPGIGAALTAAALAVFPIRHRPGVWMFSGVVIFGLATIVFGLSKSFSLSLLALFFLGSGDMLSVFVRQTLVQLQTPDSIRGRVSAVNSMFIGASNELGEFESGVTARLLGPVAAVVAGGIATLLVVAVYLKVFPQLRTMRELQKE